MAGQLQGVTQLTGTGMLIGGKIRLNITNGDLSQVTDDTIVNSVIGSEFDLADGYLSRRLSDKAGPELQNACTEHGSIGVGEVVETDAFKLPCKKIIHCHLASYSQQDNNEKILKEMMKTVLKKAAKSKHTTLSFPALGTGIQLKYPEEKSAQWMVESIVDYCNLFPRCSLNTINIVLYDSASKQAFKSYLSKLPKTTETYSNITKHHVLIHNRIQFDVIFASLADAQENIVVNSTGVGVDLTMPLAKAIADKAGPELAKACTGKTVAKGELLTTPGFDMPCDHILHCNAADYSEDKDCKKLIAVLKKCLEEASKLKAVSVALPSIGLGAKGFPSKDVAVATLRALTEFSQAMPRSSVTQVKLYLYKSALSSSQLKDFYCVDIVSALTKSAPAQPVPVLIPNILKFVKGDLAEVKADVIVNSTASQISLKDGKVSTALSNKAGYALQAECTRKAPLNIGDVIDTDGYGLNCEKVLHVSCPLWSRDTSEKKLIDIITSCLSKSEELGYQTISFCALGTGLLRYPAETVANCFIKAVNQFKNIKISSVQVVAYDKDPTTIKGFEKVLGQSLSLPLKEVSTRKPVIPMHLSVNGAKLMIDLPTAWQKPTDKYTEHDVARSTTEWKDVEKDFLKTLSRSGAAILEIRRVQNPDTFFLYETHRQCRARALGKSADQVETKPLWHGCTENNVTKITCSKFDRGHANTGCLLGSGCYFAVNSNYSSQDFYSPCNANGERYMILVRVITGEYCKGNQGLKSAPYRPGSFTEQFESVVDDVNKPTMFCVFHDSSAYPEYIIKYKY